MSMTEEGSWTSAKVVLAVAIGMSLGTLLMCFVTLMVRLIRHVRRLSGAARALRTCGIRLRQLQLPLELVAHAMSK